MNSSRDSSGLLSLSSLREHETRRAQQRANAARARAEAEQLARAESERESLRTDQERQRSERAARASAQSAERDERARLDAAQAAELEQARRGARTGDELRLLLISERDSKRAAELAFTAKLLRQKMLTSLSVVACAGSWFAAVGLYFGALAPRAERVLLSVEHSLAEERQARGDAQASSARAARDRDDLSRRVGSLEQSLREARAASLTLLTPHASAVQGGVRVPPRTILEDPCKDDGDPLEPCLRH